MKGGGSNTSRIEPNGLRVCYYLILLLYFPDSFWGWRPRLRYPWRMGRRSSKSRLTNSLRHQRSFRSYNRSLWAVFSSLDSDTDPKKNAHPDRSGIISFKTSEKNMFAQRSTNFSNHWMLSQAFKCKFGSRVWQMKWMF